MRVKWKVGDFYREGEVTDASPEYLTILYECPYDGLITVKVPREECWLTKESLDSTDESVPVRVTSAKRGGARPGAGRPVLPDPVVQCPWGIPQSEMLKFKAIAEREKTKPEYLFRKILKEYVDAPQV